MSLFSSIEKLINEHGSAVILKERLEQLKERYTFLENENKELKQLLINFEESNRKLESQVDDLRSELKMGSSKNTNPHNFFCDSCASNNLKQIGTRPDPTFQLLGGKIRKYVCNDCGHESEHTLPC